ncbi:MAG: anti-sigma factor family protein [Burkholderiales bacterium]
MSEIQDDELQCYVDGELAPARRAELDAYLAHHPAEAERVRMMEATNANLRALLDPELAEPVAARFLAQPEPKPRRWKFMAMAAGLFAVGVLSGWMVRGAFTPPSQALSLPRQAAIAHAVYVPEVRHPVEVEAKEEEHLVRWLSKRLGTDLKSPKLTSLGYDLVGGRLLSGPNGPVAHFMFQDARGGRLTLYVSTQRGESRETAFRFSQEDRVSVFYWIDGKNGYALSGEIGREQLLGIANVVYQQLNP